MEELKKRAEIKRQALDFSQEQADEMMSESLSKVIADVAKEMGITYEEARKAYYIVKAQQDKKTKRATPVEKKKKKDKRKAQKKARKQNRKK